MNIDDLEEVREELYKLINNGMCLCNENVVEISERLDKLIIEKYESWLLEILLNTFISIYVHTEQ